MFWQNTVAAVSAARFTRGVHVISNRSVAPRIAATLVCCPADARLKLTAVGQSTSASASSIVSFTSLLNAGGSAKINDRLLTSPPSFTSSFICNVAAPRPGRCTETVRPSRTSFAPPVAVNDCTATSSLNNASVWFVTADDTTSAASNCATFSCTAPL